MNVSSKRLTYSEFRPPLILVTLRRRSTSPRRGYDISHAPQWSESWAYDLMGRAVKEQRVTNAVTKTTTYTYYMDGSVASIIYPSGRTITYGYDAVTRPVSAVDSANSINYVTAALYSPAGGLASLQNGAALISKFFYT
jgi:YD repeat-containing protein